MLKNIWICAVCFAAAHLSAESIGTVEFQFPPSNYDWKIFMDNMSLQNLFSPYESDEEACEASYLKLFTHREGDSLEIFVAMQSPNNEDIDDDNEIDTLASAQEELGKSLNQYLPNLRFNILDLKDFGDDGFVEYELHDGSIDVMHGYARYFLKESSWTFLLYLSTALQTEHNRILWTQVLNDAR